MKDKIFDILELGFKDDGKTFYTNEDKCELLRLLFEEESKKVFDRGWNVGYTRGEREDKIPSGW
jgi:hypothetical protein